LIFAVFLLFCFIFPRPVFAASKYWIGSAGGNISDATNWATSEGACGVGTTATAPGASDIAYFTSSCINAATIDQAWSVQGVNIASGTITQSAALTVGVSGFTQSSGTFTGNSNAIDIAGSFSLTGGTLTATSGTLSAERNFTISNATFIHNSGTIALDGTYTSSTSISTSGAVLNKVTVNRSFSAFATRTFTIAAGTTLPLGDDPTFVFSNTCGDQTCRVSVTNNGLITAGSGALNMTITGRASAYNEYLYNNGTIDFSSLTSANIVATDTNYTGKTINLSSLPSGTFVNIGNSGTIDLSVGSTFTFTGWFSNSNGANFKTNSGLKVFNMSGSFIVDSGSTFPTSDINLSLSKV